MLVAFVFPSKLFHNSNIIEGGLRISLQLKFEATECTMTHNRDKMKIHYTGDKMDFDDPLHEFIHFQVSVLTRKWKMGENMDTTFALEESDFFL